MFAEEDVIAHPRLAWYWPDKSEMCCSDIFRVEGGLGKSMRTLVVAGQSATSAVSLWRRSSRGRGLPWTPRRHDQNAGFLVRDVTPPRAQSFDAGTLITPIPNPELDTADDGHDHNGEHGNAQCLQPPAL